MNKTECPEHSGHRYVVACAHLANQVIGLCDWTESGEGFGCYWIKDIAERDRRIANSLPGWVEMENARRYLTAGDGRALFDERVAEMLTGVAA